uniref:Uncharacterized protein n=1 Tax=Ciona savignyi TaxID=51511 RepID=H2YU75_CIOSA
MVEEIQDLTNKTENREILVAKNDNNSALQPMGLIPIYLPPINNHKNAILPSNPSGFSNLGFTFLPPIYQQAEHYGRKHNFTDHQIKTELNDIVHEVLTEEILNLFEEVLIEGVEPSPRAVEHHETVREALLDRLAKSLTIELIDDVLREDKQTCVVEFFDEKIRTHRVNSKVQNVAESIFRELETELLEEVMVDVLDTVVCSGACISIIHEVIEEEAEMVMHDTLMHYGARAAFSQYQQISKFAADYVLDSMCVKSLLPQPSKPSDDLTPVIDHLMFEVLLNTLLQHDNTTDETCIPIHWYQKKLILGVMFEDTLSKLCNAIDTEIS